jgi:hypothetical protein
MDKTLEFGDVSLDHTYTVCLCRDGIAFRIGNEHTEPDSGDLGFGYGINPIFDLDVITDGNISNKDGPRWAFYGFQYTHLEFPMRVARRPHDFVLRSAAIGVPLWFCLSWPFAAGSFVVALRYRNSKRRIARGFTPTMMAKPVEDEDRCPECGTPIPFDGVHGGPLDKTHGGPFDKTHGGPFDGAHGRPFDKTHGGPFDKTHGGPFDGTHGRPFDGAHGGPLDGTRDMPSPKDLKPPDSDPPPQREPPGGTSC